MTLHYHADNDVLPIEFSERPSVDGREFSEAVSVDYDAQGRLVVVEIDSVDNKIGLDRVLPSNLPDAVASEVA